MILEVVKYGHPVLRQKGARIEAVTPAIHTLARDMLATMYAAHGIGLAAQQVGQALQLTVLDIRGITDRPSQLTLDGQASAPEAFMPLVLVNPEITPLAPLVSGPEGCLSFPELFGDVPRPESARVQAWDADGQPLDFQCGGLLARAIQHEHDHLHGILFIDRMDKATRETLRPDLERLQAETKTALRAAQK